MYNIPIGSQKPAEKRLVADLRKQAVEQVAALCFSEELFAELFCTFGGDLGLGVLQVENMSKDNKIIMFPMLQRHLLEKLREDGMT